MVSLRSHDVTIAVRMWFAFLVHMVAPRMRLAGELVREGISTMCESHDVTLSVHEMASVPMRHIWCRRCGEHMRVRGVNSAIAIRGCTVGLK